MAVAAVFLSRPVPEATIRAALASTTVDRLSFHDEPAREAVTVIVEAFRHQHPVLRSVRVVSHPFTTADGSIHDPLAAPVLPFDFSNIPADEAFSWVAYSSGIGCAVRDGTIHFYRIIGDNERVPPLTRSEQLSARVTNLYWQAWWVLHR